MNVHDRYIFVQPRNLASAIKQAFESNISNPVLNFVEGDRFKNVLPHDFASSVTQLVDYAADEITAPHGIRRSKSSFATSLAWALLEGAQKKPRLHAAITPEHIKKLVIKRVIYSPCEHINLLELRNTLC